MVIVFIIVKSWFDVKVEFIGGVIIGLLSGQIIPAWKYFFNTEHKNSTIIPCPKATFNGGIINNRRRYQKGSVNINFISEYTGKLKNGYFVNEIVFSDNKGCPFPIDLPYIEGNVARLRCNNTIDN